MASAIDTVAKGMRRHWKRLAVVLLIVAACVVVRAAWRKRLVGLELERVRSLGKPTSTADLAAASAVPWGTPDATAAWQAPLAALSARALGRYPYGFDVLDASGATPSPKSTWARQKEAEEFVRRHQALYAQIDAAAAAPGVCCFVQNFDGYGILLDHTQQLRQIARLLVLRAYAQAGQGDWDGAAKSLRVELLAADALRREPFVVSQLVRIVCTQQGVLAVEHLLSQSAWGESRLANLQQALLKIDFLAGIRTAIDGERVLGQTAFDDPAGAGAPNVPSPIYQTMVRDDRLKFLTVIRDFETWLQDDWPAPLRRSAHIQQSKGPQNWSPSTWNPTAWHRPSDVAGPLRTLIERAAIETARLRAAATGVAAVRFRAAQGRWPKSLDELVPAQLALVPIDPCTGESLRMRVEGGGLIIFGAGIDGQDDGGVEMREIDNGGAYRKGKPDVTFRAEAPPRPNS